MLPVVQRPKSQPPATPLTDNCEMSVEDKPVHVYSESKRTVTVKSTEPETKENTSK